MNYLEFFGLQSEPFLNSPSSRVFYKSAAHGKALLKLMTAADGEGEAVCLFGRPGTGKSLLLRRVLEAVSEESTRSAYVTVPPGGLSEAALAALLSVQLRDEARASLAELAALIGRIKGEGLNVLILVDDADRLDGALRQALAKLTGANIIFTSGTEELPEGDLFELPPLNAEACEAYIRLRLKTSGRVQQIFSDKALAKVFELSDGVPFRINAVCELSLITAALAGQERVDENVVAAAAALAPHSAAVPSQAMAGLGVGAVNDAATGLGAAQPAEEPPATDADQADEDEDTVLDDLLGELEKDDEPEGSSDGADFSLDATNDVAAASTPPADASAGDDLGGLLDELEQEEAAAEEPATDVQEDAGSDLDDILGGLEAEEQAASTDADEASVDDLLGQLETGHDASAEGVAAAADSQDDDLDSLLDDLAAGEEAPSAEPPSAGGGDLDDLLSELGGDDGEVAATAAGETVGDDLDDLLGDLDAEEAAAEDASAEDDLDSLLNGLAGEEDAGDLQAAAESDDDLDDLLDGLSDDGPAVGASAESDDDLDDLLAGLTDDEPAAPAPNEVAGTAVAQGAAAGTGQADGGELDDLLNSLEEDIGKPAASTQDSLEDELDSLLEGLDD